MRPYPILFRPILKEKVWGGRRLAALGKTLAPGSTIGESWELADLPSSIPGGRSVIDTGPLAGRTLHDAIGDHRQLIMGATGLTDDDGFPLLIKFLDACDNLSVQVHPDEAWVRDHPADHLKSEAWVIVAAEPGDSITVADEAAEPLGDPLEQQVSDFVSSGVVDGLEAIEIKV